MSEIEDVRSSIAEITVLMAGPLSNLERALYHADRKELLGRLEILIAECSQVQMNSPKECKMSEPAPNAEQTSAKEPKSP